MLAIDIGNSRIKWALFRSGEIVRHNIIGYKKESFLKALQEGEFPLGSNRLVISHVAGDTLKQQLINWLKLNNCQQYSFAETRGRQCSVINSYKSPASMGVDRWLAMIAAYNNQPMEQHDAICIVDCGTAITLDVLDPQGQHLGGLIMPGYQTMIRSLTSGSANIQLPVMERAYNVTGNALASSTREAVEAGCMQLIINGISGVLQQQKKQLPGKLHCVISGGDGLWVSEALLYENIYSPYLVLQGLNCVENNPGQA